MKIIILFYGVLKKTTGRKFRIYEDVKSVDDLKTAISVDYPEFDDYRFMFSLNNKFIGENTALKDGDEIALVPPFEGG